MEAYGPLYSLGVNSAFMEQNASIMVQTEAEAFVTYSLLIHLE